MYQQQMNYLSKRKDEYLIRDPNLNIHFKIKNGVRYWLTPPPLITKNDTSKKIYRKITQIKTNKT